MKIKIGDIVDELYQEHHTPALVFGLFNSPDGTEYAELKFDETKKASVPTYRLKHHEGFLEYNHIYSLVRWIADREKVFYDFCEYEKNKQIGKAHMKNYIGLM